MHLISISLIEAQAWVYVTIYSHLYFNALVSFFNANYSKTINKFWGLSYVHVDEFGHNLWQQL